MAKLLFYHLKPSGVSHTMCFKGNELFAVLTAHLTDLHACINNAVIKRNGWKAVYLRAACRTSPRLLWLFERAGPACAEPHLSHALTKTFFLSKRHQRRETLLNICHALLYVKLKINILLLEINKRRKAVKYLHIFSDLTVSYLSVKWIMHNWNKNAFIRINIWYDPPHDCVEAYLPAAQTTAKSRVWFPGKTWTD